MVWRKSVRYAVDILIQKCWIKRDKDVFVNMYGDKLCVGGGTFEMITSPQLLPTTI